MNVDKHDAIDKLDANADGERELGAVYEHETEALEDREHEAVDDGFLKSLCWQLFKRTTSLLMTSKLIKSINTFVNMNQRTYFAIN